MKLIFPKGDIVPPVCGCTRPLLLCILAIAMGIGSAQIAAAGESPSRNRRYRSPEDFVEQMKAFHPVEVWDTFARKFQAWDELSADYAKDAWPVLPADIEAVDILLQDEDYAVVFAKAFPPTSATRSATAVVFILRLAPNYSDPSMDCWRISDDQAFASYGKYSDVKCELTAAGENDNVPVPVEGAVFTVTKTEGGRGASDKVSFSFRLKEGRIAMETVPHPAPPRTRAEKSGTPAAHSRQGRLDGNLLRAAKAGDLAAASAALRAGASINSRTRNERESPLAEAVESNHLEIAGWLLQHGADPNLPKRGLTTPLQLAENLSMTQLLVEHGADVNRPDKNGQAPLAWAAFSGNLPIAGYLVKHGADVNATDKFGQTPLQMAEGLHHEEMVAWLLVHGGGH